MIDLSKGHIEFKYTLTDLTQEEALRLDAETRINIYEELLAKAIIMRANSKDSSIGEYEHTKVFPYIKYILEWLRSTDFYTAPASTRWHEDFHGGLLIHTLNVYVQLAALRDVPKFRDVVDNQWWSAVFVALVHDWCKIGRYESYLKWVKDDDNGDWHQEPAYRYKEDNIGRLGHGTQSLIMAMQLCNSKYTSLSFEEMAAIRWHMDYWDVSDYDYKDLHKCNSTIPMVKMIQFADQLAITEY